MRQSSRDLVLPFIAALVPLALAGCTAAATPSPSESMADHSAMPSESMADHSAMPSESMADHSAMPSESMADHSAMPSESMADHSASPAAAIRVSTGSFHGVDGAASGMVALYHNADGTFTITFEGFSIASASGTDVILVTNTDVTKDGDVDRSAITDLGPLKGTSGMQDFSVPASADAMTFHTVVLWDTAMAHAIAAASLR
jgi:hypothetical protein